MSGQGSLLSTATSMELGRCCSDEPGEPTLLSFSRGPTCLKSSLPKDGVTGTTRPETCKRITNSFSCHTLTKIYKPKMPFVSQDRYFWREQMLRGRSKIQRESSIWETANWCWSLCIHRPIIHWRRSVAHQSNWHPLPAQLRRRSYQFLLMYVRILTLRNMILLEAFK